MIFLTIEPGDHDEPDGGPAVTGPGAQGRVDIGNAIVDRGQPIGPDSGSHRQWRSLSETQMIVPPIRGAVRSIGGR